MASENLFLREINLSDIHFVLEVENNRENWEVSGTQSEYMIDDIVALVESLKDVKNNKQVRYIILKDNRRIGTVDIANIDFVKGIGSIGVIISEKKNRKKGFAHSAIIMMEDIALDLGLSGLHAMIYADNEASINLFLKAGYEKNSSPDGLDLDNGDYINVEHYVKWLKR